MPNTAPQPIVGTFADTGASDPGGCVRHFSSDTGITPQLREAALGCWGVDFLLEKSGDDILRVEVGKSQDRVWIRVSDEGVEIGFPGTWTKAQWRKNFNLKPEYVGPHRVPGGFAEDFHQLAGAAMIQLGHLYSDVPIVPEAVYPKLRLGGHSRGAVFAVLFALEYGCLFEEVELVTFGAPRCVGMVGAEMVTRHTGQALRFVHNNDPVCRLPGKFRGYFHAGNLRYIDRKGWVHLSWRGFAVFRDRLLGRIGALIQGDVFDGWTDHGVADYWVALHGWRERLQAQGTGDQATPLATPGQAGGSDD